MHSVKSWLSFLFSNPLLCYALRASLVSFSDWLIVSVRCEANGRCELQSLVYRYNVATPETPQPEDKTDALSRNMELCINCGRCVRVCSDVQGMGSLDFFLVLLLLSSWLCFMLIWSSLSSCSTFSFFLVFLCFASQTFLRSRNEVPAHSQRRKERQEGNERKGRKAKEVCVVSQKFAFAD
jgi:ferredoxin